MFLGNRLMEINVIYLTMSCYRDVLLVYTLDIIPNRLRFFCQQCCKITSIFLHSLSSNDINSFLLRFPNDYLYRIEKSLTLCRPKWDFSLTIDTIPLYTPPHTHTQGIIRKIFKFTTSIKIWKTTWNNDFWGFGILHLYNMPKRIIINNKVLLLFDGLLHSLIVVCNQILGFALGVK